MASTYEPIATTTLGSNASSVTFSSISGSFTDLRIVLNGIEPSGGGGDFIALQYNGDTSSAYSATYMWGTGSAAQSGRFSTQTSGAVGAIYATNIMVMTCDILNYSNSTTYKTAISRSSSAGNNTGAFVSLWQNTQAITSVKVLNQGGNFASGATFSLYGIKAA